MNKRSKNYNQTSNNLNNCKNCRNSQDDQITEINRAVKNSQNKNSSYQREKNNKLETEISSQKVDAAAERNRYQG